VAAAISQVPFLDRDSQTYRGSPEVTTTMLAAARDNGVPSPSPAAELTPQRLVPV
jgi:hypothetical protein